MGKISYDYVKSYFEDQGCELLETEYINAHIKMQYRCNCGNISLINWNNFQDGKRCKKCGVFKNTTRLDSRLVKDYFRSNGCELLSDNPCWISDRQKLQENNMFSKKCRMILEYTLDAVKKDKTDKTYKLLGYSNKDLQQTITNHPNWDAVDHNYWHLDHIFPIKAFIDHQIYDIKLINALDNLQPMTPSDNLLKAYKYDINEFKKWLITKDVFVK